MFATLDADKDASRIFVTRRRVAEGASGMHGQDRRGGLLLRRRHRQHARRAHARPRGIGAVLRRAAEAEDVAKIKAPLLIHYAGLDERINAGWPAYEAALKANKVRYEAFIYPKRNHGFHNDTTPRYDEAAAKLAWQRTVDFFNKNLRG